MTQIDHQGRWMIWLLSWGPLCFSWGWSRCPEPPRTIEVHLRCGWQWPVSIFFCRDPSPTQVVLDAGVIAVFQHVCCSFSSSFRTSLPISLVVVLVLVQFWMEVLWLALSSWASQLEMGSCCKQVSLSVATRLIEYPVQIFDISYGVLDCLNLPFDIAVWFWIAWRWRNMLYFPGCHEILVWFADELWPIVIDYNVRFSKQGQCLLRFHDNSWAAGFVDLNSDWKTFNASPASCWEVTHNRILHPLCTSTHDTVTDKCSTAYGISYSNPIRIDTGPFIQEFSKQYKVMFLNAQSVRNKALDICDYIMQANVDLFSCVKHGFDQKAMGLTVQPWHHLVFVWSLIQAVGLLFYIDPVLQKHCSFYSRFCFYGFWGMWSASYLWWSYCSVYRPPPSRQNRLINAMLLEQFSYLLESYVSCDKLFVVGRP